VKGRIVSPTFVLMKIYDIDPAKAGQGWHRFEKLIHIDAYRIEDEKELLNLGWESLVSDPKNLIFVEWPERVKGIMPKDAKIIEFKHES
jgi:tRNA A37 threonylcarbamoyladenosine biosynthesis protein TsaE